MKITELQPGLFAGPNAAPHPCGIYFVVNRTRICGAFADRAQAFEFAKLEGDCHVVGVLAHVVANPVTGA